MKLKQIRINRNLSQEQLAELSGLNVRTIQRLEKGSKPSLESLKCLASALSVEVSDITDASEKITKPNNKPKANLCLILLAVAFLLALFGAKSEVVSPETGAFFYICAAVCFIVASLIMSKERLGNFY